MNTGTITLIHLLLASLATLGPLSIALYLDLKQERKAGQTSH